MNQDVTIVVFNFFPIIHCSKYLNQLLFLISLIFISCSSILSQVQAVAWNHHQPRFLISGTFDRTVVLVVT